MGKTGSDAMAAYANFGSIRAEPGKAGRLEQRLATVQDWWSRNVGNVTVALVISLIIGGWSLKEHQVQMAGHIHLIEYRVSQLERFQCPPTEIRP